MLYPYKAYEYARTVLPDGIEVLKREPYLRQMLSDAYDAGARETLYEQPLSTYQFADNGFMNVYSLERILDILKKHGRCQIIGGEESSMFPIIADVLKCLNVKITVPLGK